MSTLLTYDFCDVEVHNSYMIVVMNTGTHISPDYNKVLTDIVTAYFSNKPFVYITHRKNSYSVDPTIYKRTSKIKNLVGFAVVAAIPISKANAEVEKQFMTKPFEIFQTLASATKWAKSLVKAYEA
jgi:hypothetical protein